MQRESLYDVCPQREKENIKKVHKSQQKRERSCQIDAGSLLRRKQKEDQSRVIQEVQQQQRKKKSQKKVVQDENKLSQNSTTLNIINPWMSQTLKHGYDLASMNLLQQQLALAQQLQTPVFQQTSLLQPMLLTGQQNLLGMSPILNTSTQFHQNTSLLNSMPITKLNSPSQQQYNPLSRTLQQNTSILNHKQTHHNNHKDKIKTLEDHQEQIEAIELLIKDAKSKLENNLLNNQNTNCRLIDNSNVHIKQRSTRNQTRAITKSIKEEIEMKNKRMNFKPSRNETALKVSSSYNSNLEGNSQNHLLFRTQNSQVSNQLLERNDLQRNYDFDCESKMTYQRRENYFEDEEQYEEINHHINNNEFKNRNKVFSDQSSQQDFSISHRKDSTLSEFKAQPKFQSNNKLQNRFNLQEPNTQRNNPTYTHEEFQQSSSRKYPSKNQQFIDNHEQIMSQKTQNQQSKFQQKQRQGNKDELQTSLTFNQSISSIGLNRKQSNAEITKQGYQSNKYVLSSKDSSSQQDLLWIDFNDNKSQVDIQKKQDLKTKRLQTKQNPKQNKLSQDNYPQSIPEENDDFQSPDVQFDKLNKRRQPNNIKLNKQAVRLDIPSTTTQSTESLPTYNKLQQQVDRIQQNDKNQNALSNREKNSKQKENAWAMDFTDKAQDNSQQTNSIAEAFKNRMLNKKQQNKNNNVDISNNNSEQQEIKSKREFTKEELFERKKELLKQAREKLQKSLISKQEQQNLQEEEHQNIEEQKQSVNKQYKPQQKAVDNIPTQLLTRLSQGQKSDINKKDMLKLTTKNYEQLPEIKQKKIDSSKKEDLMKRIANVKDMEKKRRQTVVQKQQQKLQNNRQLPPSGKNNN